MVKFQEIAFVRNKSKKNICLEQKESYFHIVKQEETYLTGVEVREILKISRTTLYRLVKDKQLSYIKIRGFTRYKKSDIEKLMR